MPDEQPVTSTTIGSDTAGRPSLAWVRRAHNSAAAADKRRMIGVRSGLGSGLLLAATLFLLLAEFVPVRDVSTGNGMAMFDSDKSVKGAL